MTTGQIMLLIFLALVGIGVAMAWPKLVALGAGMRDYFGQVKFEMSKVTWPSRDEVLNSTGLVIIVAIIITLMVMVVDKGFAEIFRLLILGN